MFEAYEAQSAQVEGASIFVRHAGGATGTAARPPRTSTTWSRWHRHGAIGPERELLRHQGTPSSALDRLGSIPAVTPHPPVGGQDHSSPHSLAPWLLGVSDALPHTARRREIRGEQPGPGFGPDNLKALECSARSGHPDTVVSDTRAAVAAWEDVAIR
ncbi:hypothetical protein NKH18_15965 [Streptomyces sp. M10(2022)]